MKPPMPYFGGKTNIAEAIAALLPPHNHYVEPYCGSLSVLLAKPPAPYETVNDLDHELVNLWRVLRDRPDDLERLCALTPHSRAEQRDAYVPVSDELESARRMFVKLTQGRSGTSRRTGWRHYVHTSGVSSMPRYLRGYVGRIAPAAERLSMVSLECMPAVDIIAKYGAVTDALLYVDPPYLHSTRSSGGYRLEMADEKSHRELAEALHACLAAVVISGYPSDLYDLELYPGWDRYTIAASTGQGEEWANRTEVLWSNRPLGVQPSLLDALDEPFPSATPDPAGTVPADNEGEA